MPASCSSPGRVSATPLLVMVGFAALLLLGCGDDSEAGSSAPTPTAPSTTVASATSTTTGSTIAVVEIAVDEDSFINVNDMTAVRGFFVDNVIGDLAETVAVAENPDGGRYPPGSVVQLIPGEAMVKREPGFSGDTNDWEFFELDVSADGTEIRNRGGAETVNQFGGSCVDCHAQAEPEFDFVCEQTHGCDPLPFEREFFEALQAIDPRPRGS